MNLLNSRTWLVNAVVKSGKSIIEFIKHVYISWVVLKLKLAFGRFPFPYRNPFYHVMCSARYSCYSHGKWLFSWYTEATLARSGNTAFHYVLPLAGIFLSVADTLLLVLLVCFCHPSVVHLPLGRAITASLTSLPNFFLKAVESESYSACMWLMECSYTVEPYACAL